MIVIDTLRADRLDVYGTDRQLTPFLASLAERGTVFWSAYAASSWTSPSMASLWTSRYQSQHRVTVYSSVLADTERTLPEVLSERGYVTGGFSANPILSSPLGFAQGFKKYQVYRSGPFPFFVGAERLNRDSLAWLDTVWTNRRGAAPVFLYVQYMEPHFPYTPSKEPIERVMNSRPNLDEKRKAFADMLFFNRQRYMNPDPLAVEVMKDLYDAEVMEIDAKLRELFSELAPRGFLANSLVVITADHGEELMDHGRMGHGTTLYNEVTHVPLLILRSGQRRRVDVPDVVTLLDIAPTVLDRVGGTSCPTFEGRSLRAALSGAGLAERMPGFLRGLLGTAGFDGRPAYSELHTKPDEKAVGAPTHVSSVVVGSHKLLIGSDGSHARYDLGSDPAETNPQALNATERAALESALQAMMKQAARGVAQPRTEPPDQATRERMRALGYAD